MLARLLRWLVLGVVSCLIGTILVIVVVGALKGAPKPKPVGAVGIPSRTLRPDENGIGVNQAALNSPAGHGFATPLGSKATGSNAAQGSGTAQASNATQGAAPTRGSNAGPATEGSSPTGNGATKPGASPGASSPTPGAGNGATTPGGPNGAPTAPGATTGPSGSQTSSAGPTELTYNATAPTGSSLTYLDPTVGEVRVSGVTSWTNSWNLTPGIQSEAAIVVTGATPTSTVSCSILWHGAAVATKTGTGRADCESVVG